jgi:plasmid stabilization system protein ParE
MKVRFTPRARSDLAAILTYLDERSPKGARNVQGAIQRTIELIEQVPQGGRSTGVQATRVLQTGRFPYLIYWSIESGEAWLVHIRHAARRPWAGNN